MTVPSDLEAVPFPGHGSPPVGLRACRVGGGGTEGADDLNIADLRAGSSTREQGPRPMDLEWATDLRDQCRRAGVLFFFKQWGGRNKKKAGRLLHGRTWDQMPPDPAADEEQAVPGLRVASTR